MIPVRHEESGCEKAQAKVGEEQLQEGVFGQGIQSFHGQTSG